DANNDGVADGLAWIIGAAGMNVAANSLLPTAAHGGGNFQFNFRCRNAATRGNVALFLEFSSELGGPNPWTSIAVPDVSSTVSGVSFTITPDGDFMNVTAAIPSTEAAAGLLFTRLRIVTNS
ncbi:MAG: hypothetical protein JNG86_08585, partial [Verrucomicrobiaceae bacterium]|nr:hypothetical protein [Verrucomicrobiaceae bacterium]